MFLIFGLIIILVAGFFQGTFILPLSYTTKWKWENTWLAFSLLGMIVLNWIWAFIFIPELLTIYSTVPASNLAILILFGLGWGLGAVLFGIGMDKLGMALGYPVIMGLTASIGGLLPLFIQQPENILQLSGIVLITGVIIALVGIIICSKAAAIKSTYDAINVKKDKLTAGIIIAIAAGVLSSLPNMGFSFGTAVTQAAIERGTSPALAGNSVWALFFSFGFIPNLIYTVWLMIKNKTYYTIITGLTIKNTGLSLLMAVLWIGSFYLYGFSSYNLGDLGKIVGWPLFISISIVVGNLWGLWKGEWRNSSKRARTMLNIGLVVLIIALIIFCISNIL
ncbi:MAG: hypothetical protein LBR84_10005 [Tannerella sp.]|jgi:L-rhamnose-H+ transport protein|nr:hypothetical protein [Tannerella sp.]